MGRYTTDMITDRDAERLIDLFRTGYTYNGVKHRPNKRIAAILQIENNLGLRLSDVVNLNTDSFVREHGTWVLNITEKKTGKARHFVVPDAVKEYVDSYCADMCIVSGRLFRITEYAVWNAMEQATEYLGLHNTSTHSFRKAAAMRVYEASGKDVALTSQFMQHSSPSTTLRYLRRTTKQMDDVLSKTVMLV